MDCLVRLSTPYLNNDVNSALVHRNAIVESASRDDVSISKSTKEGLYEDSARTIRSLILRPKILTEGERGKVVEKYKSGMRMTAIANIYGCHYTTVGRILRKRGIEI